jgi:tRNA-2-methylthio-N6-dimethylallyladenosine synthase
VRQHAENRLFSNIGDLAGLKKKRPDVVIGLMGCTAQSYKDKALERAPLLDFVCGTGNEGDLPEMIRGLLKDRCCVVAADKVNKKKPELLPAYREGKFKTFVSIGEGCDNFCSYCIVPYVRGRERSRDAKDIIREVKDLAGRGFKEITLLGQNVNSYGTKSGGDPDFADLIRAIDAIGPNPPPSKIQLSFRQSGVEVTHLNPCTSPCRQAQMTSDAGLQSSS